MKRLFWFALGLGLAWFVMFKAKQVYAKATPENLRHTVADASSAMGSRVERFFADVREGSAEREVEIKEALGLIEEVDEPAARRADAVGEPA